MRTITIDLPGSLELNDKEAKMNYTKWLNYH